MASKNFVALHHRVARSETLHRLRTGPVAGGVKIQSTGPSREIISRLKAPPGGSRGGTKARGDTKVIYYLYGDERRAIRQFIDENEEYVRSCIEDHQRAPGTNPLERNWDPILWQLLLEEWDFRTAEEVTTDAA